MENLERYYEILGVKRGASLKEIRKAYKCLQEEYYLDYYSKSFQGQEKACEEALREIYSAYKKLKVFHKEHSEEFASDEQDGVSVNVASATGESAIDQARPIRDDAGQAADESATVEDPALSIAQQVVAGYNKSDAVRILNEKLAALKAEIDRLTPEKDAAAQAAEDELAAEKTDADKALGTAVSANPTPVRFYRFLAYGGILGAVGILAYAMVTPRHAADGPSLMLPSQETLTTRKAAPPEAGTKRIVAPVPVVEKQALPTSPVVKPPTTVSTPIKARPTTHSGRKLTAAVSGKKSVRTTGRSRIAGTKTAYKRSEAKDGNNRKHAVMSTEIKEPKYQAKVAALTKPAATTAIPPSPATAATPPPSAIGFYAAVGTANRYYLFRGNIRYAGPYYNGPWVQVGYRALPWGLRKYPITRNRYIRDEGYRHHDDEGDYQYRHFRPRYRQYKHWKDVDDD